MSRRPRIALLPGLLCDDRVFGAQIAALSPHAEVRVADFRHARSIEEMGAIGLSLFEGPITVLGYSMGGRAALECWRQAPGRIERLILMDTGFGPLREGETPGREAQIALCHEKGMTALAASWLPPMLHPDRETDPALLAPLTAMVERATPDQHERQIRALIARPDAGPLLPTITCPTLVMVGRQDRWATLAQHRALAAAIPGALLEIIEDAGHFTLVERPEAVNAALLRFLGTPPAEPDRIPDTPLFDRARQRMGYNLNRATMDLRHPERRAAFQRDPGAYLDGYGVTADQKRAALACDWRELVRLGGNVFHILKLSVFKPARMTEIGAHQAGMDHDVFLRERLGKR